MSNLNYPLRNKFSDFEPDVPEERIAGNWEKIKYFLPQKKRKRRFLWLPVFYGIALLVVVLSAGFLVYFNTGHSPSASALAVVKAEDTSFRSLAGQDQERIKHSALKPGGAAFRETPVIAIPAEEPGHKMILQEEDLNIPASAKAAEQTARSHKEKAHDKNTGSVPSCVQEKEKKEIAKPGLAGKELTPDYEMVVGSSSYDTLLPEFVYLDPKTWPGIAPLQLAEIREQALYTIPKGVPPASRAKVLFLELFGGFNRADTRLSLFETKEDKRIKTNSISAGLGVHYQLAPRYALAAMFTYAGNGMEITEEISGNRIVAKKPITGNVIVSGGGNQDTVVSYFKVNLKTSLSSRSVLNGALGLNYTLFTKHRTTVEAFVLLNMRYTRYTFKSVGDAITDTLVYFRYMSSPPLANTISPEIADQNFKRFYSVISLGILPGLNFTYALNNRCSLLFKPVYFIDLSNDRMNKGKEIFHIRQDYLSLYAGMRFRF